MLSVQEISANETTDASDRGVALALSVLLNPSSKQIPLRQSTSKATTYHPRETWA